jgi:hypothetical protein
LRVIAIQFVYSLSKKNQHATKKELYGKRGDLSLCPSAENWGEEFRKQAGQTTVIIQE